MGQKTLVRKAEPPSKRGIAWPRWTGFRGKTVWDWLQLISALAIPVVLALAGLYFEAQLDERQRKSDERRAQTEHQLEERRADDAALQAYLDQIGTLMLNKNLLESEPGDSAYTLAQARTSTAISRLDADHNRHVTRFLSDSGLSGQGGEESSISLFRQIDLSGAELSGADLSGSILDSAWLRGVDLQAAELDGADLPGAYLIQSDLQDARLDGADLHGANVEDTDLSGADVTQEQLASCASLRSSTMPDGQTLKGYVKGTRNGPTFEEWLKDKEARKKVGKNE